MNIQRIPLCVLTTFSLSCLASQAPAPSLAQLTASAPTPQPTRQKHGISYELNRFGDVLPNIQDVDAQELRGKLSKFVAEIEETGAPVIVTIPTTQLPLLDALKETGFHCVYSNDTETRWIRKHKANIPSPFTAIAGGEVVVINEKNEMLIVEEHTRKNRMSFPAGHVDPQEYSRNAAARELKEEVGLTVKPENLKLIALVNRTRANKEGASDYNHYYLAQQTTGEVTTDNKEIIKAHWVPVEKLARGEKVENLESNPIVKLLAQHILTRCKESQRHTIQNYRRRETPMWPQNDPKDVMNVELFQQNMEPVAQTENPLHPEEK